MQLKVHPRTCIVDDAQHEFGVFMRNLQQKYGLTYSEMFSILGLKISDLARFAIRSERHPDDPDKGGDDA